jgi:cytochrome c oxidase subunit I+III
MLTAFVFFLLGGLLALLMRLQLVTSEQHFMGPQLYNQLFTMHGSTMMYLFSVPFLEGLAMYLLPLTIGSRDLAFPRLSAFGYWMYLFGGCIFYLSFVVGHIPDAGWFAYTPLSETRYSGLGLDFWAVGLGMVEVSGIAAGVELVVTVLKVRAPGMTLGRMPLFAWSILAAGMMSLVAFTTLLIATLMLELSRAAGFQFFNEFAGGNHLLWQHLFWFFGHPEVYIIFLPATGIVSMVVATWSKRLVGYNYLAVAILVTAFVSFGLWVHHMYATGLPPLSLNFFAAASLMIAIASGTQVFAWIATLWGTRPALTPPMLYVLGFIIIFVMGGMTGVMVAVVPFDWQVHDTYFIVAHFHYVLIGGAVFPMLAGVHYWFPKFSGRMMHPWLGYAAFWLAFVGFHATFFPMHIMGFFGLPRRVYTYPAVLQLDDHNVLATVGAFVFGIAFLLIIIDLIWSALYGEVASDNPWGADTLEWSVPSPPPTYGFLMPPTVVSRHPLWHSKATQAAETHDAAEHHAARELYSRPLDWRATLVTDSVFGIPQAIQSLPGPTYTPLVSAIGLLIAALAILAKVYLLAIVGLIVLVAGLARWMVPSEAQLELIKEDPFYQQASLPIDPSGSRSVSWWAMIGWIVIEASALAALLYSYFYVLLYADAWPQSGAAAPAAGWFTLALGAQLLAAGTLVLVRWLDHNRWRWTSILCVAGGMFASLIAILLDGAGCYAYGLWGTESAYASLFVTLHAFLWLVAGLGIVFGGNLLFQLFRYLDKHPSLVELNLQITSQQVWFAAAAGVACWLAIALTT